MIELAPPDRNALIQTFGCSRRLAARLGALLGKGIAVSATLVEEAGENKMLEAFLLHKVLLEDGPALAQRVAELLKAEAFSALMDWPAPIVLPQGEWLVIAAAEEQMAEKGFVAQPPEENPAPSVPATTSSLSLVKPPNGASPGGTPFTENELARIQVNIFAAATSAEKVAALRQFAFAPLPAEDRLDVFLKALADEDQTLRSAAATGLGNLGLSKEIANASRHFAEGAADERRTAGERLCDLASSADPLGSRAILMTFLGVLRDSNTDRPDQIQTIQYLAASASDLGADLIAREEVLRTVLEPLLAADDAMRSCLRSALRAFDLVAPGQVGKILIRDLCQSQAPGYRGSLIELISGINMDLSADGPVLEIAVETCLALPTDRSSCRAAGSFLIRSGATGIRHLTAAFPKADTAHQRYLIRLFDNALRTGTVPPELRQDIADHALIVLGNSPKQVRSELIETELLAHPALHPETRAKAAYAFLQDLHEYNHFPLSQILESVLIRLGGPAVPALLTSLAEKKNVPDVTVLTSVLGHIGRGLAAREEPAAREQAEEILRKLQALTFRDEAFRDVLHLAMGRICSKQGIKKEVANLILRTLLNRLDGSTADACTIEALGLLCAGNGATLSDVQTVAQLALQHLKADQPDPSLSVEEIEGEEVFRLGAEVDVYAELIPRCLQALQSLMPSPVLPADTRRDILNQLLDLWSEAIRRNIQWGPANVTRLIETLGAIALQVDGPTRTRIANSLAQRAGEIAVLEALAEILILRDDSAQLDRLGGALLLRLLKLIEEGEDLTSEDREIYLRLLTRVSLRGRFEIRGGSLDRLYQRVTEAILAGTRQNVPGCTGHLTAIRDGATWPQEHLTRIEKELKRLTSLAVR